MAQAINLQGFTVRPDRLAIPLRRFLDQHRFLRGVAILGSGNAAGQAVSLIVSPIVSRLFTPDDFGVVAAISSVVGLLAVLVTWSYQNAIVLPDNEQEARNVLWLCILLIIVTSSLAAIVLPWIAPHLGAFTQSPEALRFAYMIPIWSAFHGLLLTGNAWAIRLKSFRRLTRSRMGQSMAAAAAKLAFGWAGMQAGGLVLGTAMVQIAGSFVLYLPWPRRDQYQLGRPTWRGIKTAAARYARFPVMTTPTALINAAGTQLPPLMLTALYGTQVTGWYSMSYRVATLAISFVSIPMGQAFLGEMSALIRTDPSVMYRLFTRIFRLLVLIAIAPMLVVLFFGDPLVGLVFGPSWVTSGKYLEMMAIMLFASLLATPLCQVFSLLERQDLGLIWNVARLLVLAALYAWARTSSPSSESFILALSCANAGCDLVRLVLAARIIKTKSLGLA